MSRRTLAPAFRHLPQIVLAALLAAAVTQPLAMGSRHSASKTVAPAGASANIEAEAMLVQTLIEVRNNRLDAALTEEEVVSDAGRSEALDAAAIGHANSL